MKDQLEKDIESDIVDYAEMRGWFEFKVERANKNGLPDRFFFRNKPSEGKRTVCIEVKRVGETPTRQQLRRHKELRDHGVEVYWTDSLEEARQWLK